MSEQLKEKLGMFSAVMVVISAMIGSGVFKKISVMSHDLPGSGWVLAAWAAAGLITLMGSVSNAEVAGMIARPGGQYVYFQAMYGKAFAFLFGWSSFTVIQTATAASVAYVFAESVNSLLPLPCFPEHMSEITLFQTDGFSLKPLHNAGVKGLACMLVLGLSLVNYRGIDYGERISNILGGTVVAGILFIMVYAFVNGQQNLNLALPSDKGSEVSAAMFFSAMMAAFWAYEGWNNVGFLGGEIKNPKRNIPIALGLGTLVVMFLYISVNAAYFKLADSGFYKSLYEQENTIAAVAGMNLIWAGGGMLISILILASTFNSTNNSLMTAPRIYYTMARDGLFIKSAGEVHKTFQTPHKSIVYQMFWCLVLIISGSFDMLTEMLVFVAFIFYGCGAFGVIVLRRKMPETPRPFKVPLYPFTPLLFTVFCVFLIGYTILESPVNALLGLALVSLGIPVYLWYGRKSP